MTEFQHEQISHLRAAHAAAKAERDTLAELLREVLRAGNANTRATKELMRQAGTSWARRTREALAKIATK